MRHLTAIALLTLLASSQAHADTQQYGIVCSVNQHGPSSSYGQNGWATFTLNIALDCTNGVANIEIWICGTGATACSGPLFGDAQQQRLVKTLLDAMPSKQVLQVGYTSAQVLDYAAVTVNGGKQAP
jgi:hypothetical protein